MVWVTVKGISERQGFEPWNPCGLRVFQTRALDHYATPPKFNLLNWWPHLQPNRTNHEKDPNSSNWYQFRRVEDSNLRSSYDDNGFRDRRIQPALPTLQNQQVFVGELNGGAGIRTLGGDNPHNSFQDCRFQPLSHPTKESEQEKLLKNCMKYILSYIKRYITKIHKRKLFEN